MLRTPFAVVPTATVASAASSGMLHPRAKIIPDPRPALLFALLQCRTLTGHLPDTLSCGDCFRLNGEFMFELVARFDGRRNHSFRFCL
jgi:hypothetical protein